MAGTTLNWKDDSERNHEIVYRFEKAFAEGKNPQVKDYLDGDGASRWQLLMELLHSNLELRIRAGQSLRVQDYLNDHGELVQHADDLAGLIKTEIRCLRQMGIQPMLQKYQAEYGSILGKRVEELFAHESRGTREAKIGSIIAGKYKLLAELGEGGMGSVYAAEQTQPVRRTVAIKLIKPGMDSSGVLARFEAERQALAMMDHPNIARMLDGGITEDGQPYFVMEQVKGLPITRFCDQERLSLDDRIELFMAVCQGVQHAHQKGIIHRDLKPSNILVTLIDGKPVPKVIDFGVAKALHQKLTDKTMYTEAGRMVGTLEYMAPEQADMSNLDIDTRADVYSLGVLLYELLTGQLPFTSKELRKHAHFEMLRILREQDPPRPSTKLSSSNDLSKVAALRQLAPNQLTTLISSELDWVVLKCLEKQRNNRYNSPIDLAKELSRWINGEVIQARPISPAKRLYKWVKRNPSYSIAICSGIVLISGLIVAGFWFQNRIHAIRIESELTTRANELVNSLCSADISQVQRIIGDIHPLRNRATPLLKAASDTATFDSRAKLHCALALLPVEMSQLDTVYHFLFKSTPQELEVIRVSLELYKSEVNSKLWVFALDNSHEKERRFRAACVLAGLDPENSNWSLIAPFVVSELVSANPLLIGLWTDCLYPIRKMLVPLLSQLCTQSYDNDQEEHDIEAALAQRQKRNVAVSIVSRYAADDVHTLAYLISEGDAKQFTTLFPLLQRYTDIAIDYLEGELLSMKTITDTNSKESLRQARKSANIAIALIMLGKHSQAWKYYKECSDPTSRTHLIHLMQKHGVVAQTLIDKLEDSNDTYIRRTLLLSLGQYLPNEIPTDSFNRVTQMLDKWYRDDIDSGVHGAVRWLLQKWKCHHILENADRSLNVGLGDGSRKWYMTKHGHTMVILKMPDNISLGSPSTEPGHKKDEERNRIKRVKGYSFAMSDTPITKEQYEGYRANFRPKGLENINPNPKCPVLAATWYDAAGYCNWLSKQEGIPESEWCYLPNAEGNYAEGMQVAKGYQLRTGFRLPLEDEWEYACRAGTATRYYFGSCDEWLPEYAWFVKNSKQRAWPVGLLKPNDYGLFDMHGNAVSWCQDIYDTAARSAFEPKSFEGIVNRDDYRILRGGQYVGLPQVLRAASLFGAKPDTIARDIGFRIVRTVRPH